MKEFMKKHVDTVIIFGGVIGSFLWMNSSINTVNGSISALKTEMNERFAVVDQRFSAIDLKFAALESDIRNINTILICKDVMPKGIALDAKQEIPAR